MYTFYYPNEGGVFHEENGGRGQNKINIRERVDKNSYLPTLHPFTRLSSSMAPPNWATSEQLHFLRGYIPIFVEYTAKENQSKFWPRLNEAWFSCWPELDVLIKENKLPPQASTSDPDAPDDPNRETPRYQLTIEERELYGTAIQTRKQVSVHLLKEISLTDPFFL